MPKPAKRLAAFEEAWKAITKSPLPGGPKERHGVLIHPDGTPYLTAAEFNEWLATLPPWPLA